jgi:hypothetical protein
MKRPRRSLRHLAAIAVGGGFITLAVAITGIDPAWLAVGPLLLVLVDTLAFSPVIRSRVAAAIARLSNPRYAFGPPGFGGRGFGSTGAPRGSLLATLAVALGLAAAVYYLPFSVPFYGWAALLGVIVVAGVLALVVPRFTGRYAFSFGVLPDPIAMSQFRLSFPGDPVLWLQEQLDAVGDGPLSIVVVAFAGPAPAGPLVAMVTVIAQAGAPHIHYLSDDEFLLVGAPHDVSAALSIFGLGRLSVRPAGASVPTILTGEAVYPQDGTSPDELLAKARQKAQRHAT